MKTTARLTSFAWVVLSLVAAITPLRAQVKETEDLAIYRVIRADETPTAKRIELSETFLADPRPLFRDSMWRTSVYQNLFVGYRDEMNWVKLIDTADRLEKLIPLAPPEERKDYYLTAMQVAYNQRMDVDKTVDMAEKVVAIDPVNPYALLALSSNIPTLPKEPAEREVVVLRVVDYSRKLLNVEKPNEIEATQWDSWLKQIRIQSQALQGQIFLAKKEYPECAAAYEELARLDPGNAGAYYGVGICLYPAFSTAYALAMDANTKHIDFINACNAAPAPGCGSEENQAGIKDLFDKEQLALKASAEARMKPMEAFARSVAVGGTQPEAVAARTNLEALYSTIAPKPSESVDDFIAKKKKELGQ